MKLFVILSRVPYPLEKGDKLRAFNQIRELSQKHQIILFALNDSILDDKALNELKKYCVAISILKFSKFTIFFNLIRAFFNGNPLQVGYFYFSKAQKKVDELIARHKPDHIYCQLIRTSEYIRKYPQIPKTLDYMDVFSKGMERRKSTEPFYMKPFVAMEYRRLLRYEKKAFAYFTNRTIISEQDKNLIPHPDKQKILVVPNGVDTSFFKPLQHKKEYDLLFNGNMNYPPNIESVEYLVEKVMPYIWNKLPATRLLISGASPNAAVLELASDKVIVSGWVDDIRVNFAKSKILVAPMQISIGLQNKLLEAMAMQIPCITSSLANNALGAKPGEQILVADTPEQYARHIIDLLQNETKAKQIATNGYRFVIDKFNWKTTTALLEKLISGK
ncbi:MAG TPA: glycosyltransferase [Bacteroidia bacterium]|jgi:sugar transferase (PEP-CTERM/EpsH1 system associated)